MNFPPDAMFQTGNRLGEYRIEGFLGRGGMGEVYLAVSEVSGREVAIKVLLPAVMEKRPDFVKEFLREGRVACRISHPAVITVIDAGIDEATGVCMLVMEYIDGGTVQQMIDRRDVIDWEWALVIALRVSEALEAAATLGIVHRDIKPENIMVTASGDIKLADLGIAKCGDSVEEGGRHRMIGTPAYASPEQCADSSSVDARSDIYSLGATLYEILTGELPFEGKSPLDVVRQVLKARTPDPRAVNPQIPPEVGALIMRMMSKDPAERPQSAAELTVQLRRMIYGGSGVCKQKKISKWRKFNGKITEMWRKMEHFRAELFPDEISIKLGKWILILSGLLIFALFVPLPSFPARSPKKTPEDSNLQITARIKRKMEETAREIAVCRKEIGALRKASIQPAEALLLKNLFFDYDPEAVEDWFAGGVRIVPERIDLEWISRPRSGFATPEMERVKRCAALLDRSGTVLPVETVRLLFQSAVTGGPSERSFAFYALKLLAESERNRPALRRCGESLPKLSGVIAAREKEDSSLRDDFERLKLLIAELPAAEGR